MTWIAALGLSLAGGLGAVSRFVVDGAARAWRPTRFPWPTLAVNVTGSLLLGLVTGLALFRDEPDALRVVVGTGFCGGDTTFGTASFEAVRQLERHAYPSAFAIAVGTPVLSLLAAAAGLLIAHR